MDDIETQEAWRAVLDARGEITLPVTGASMGARWRRARAVRIASASRRAAAWGDVLVFVRGDRVYAHRAIFRSRRGWLTKGDDRLAWDRPALRREDVLGVATALVPDDGRPLSHRGVALVELVCALAAWPFLGIIRRLRVFPQRSGTA